MKIFIRIVVMIILFGVSILLFGQGFTTFLLEIGLGSLTSFVNIFSGATLGETTIQSVMNFIFKLVQAIGLVLVYYLIAHLITAIFIRD